MLRGQPRTGSLGYRLDAFYQPQAGHYDAFREDLLLGRRELIARLAPAPGSRIVELGGGTGRNLDFFGESLSRFAMVDLVDICPALLARAQSRCEKWRNVRVFEGDATTWTPDAQIDCVYFSYALTMMPDWRGAIDNALAMLKPGGTLGVVDFHLPPPGSQGIRTTCENFENWFWSCWFAHDGVYLDANRRQYLASCLVRQFQHEGRTQVPYLCGLTVPYYIYVGTKSTACSARRPC